MAAANHVHVIVAPKTGHELSDILHSWKSFTAKQIIKVEAASRRLQPFWNERAKASAVRHQEADGVEYLSAKMALPWALQRTVWQIESYDHIIRNADAMMRIEQYIQNHVAAVSRRANDAQLRQDAAATLTDAACAPFDQPALCDALAKARHDAEQTIDKVTSIRSAFRLTAKNAQNVLVMCLIMAQLVKSAT